MLESMQQVSNTVSFRISLNWTSSLNPFFLEIRSLEFLVKQPDKRYLVLDGQQRLSTLRRFKDGIQEAREFPLEMLPMSSRGCTRS